MNYTRIKKRIRNLERNKKVGNWSDRKEVILQLLYKKLQSAPKVETETEELSTPSTELLNEEE